MMSVIFECETEVGKCNYDSIELRSEGDELATVLARTQATLNGQKGLLRVEHQCYVRQGEDIPEQPWIRPEIILEPGLSSKSEMIAFAKTTHQRFVKHVRSRFPAEWAS